MQFFLYAAAVLGAVSAASFLVKDEGLRGLGRVIGGVSSICVAIFLFDLRTSLNTPEWMSLFCINVNATGNGNQLPSFAQLVCSGADAIPVWVIATFAVSGLVAIVCGVRKYGRRDGDNTTPSK